MSRAAALDALSVVLAGVGVGATFHLLGHVLDRDLGGTPATDIPFFAVIAVALIAAAVAGARTRPRDADDTSLPGRRATHPPLSGSR